MTPDNFDDDQQGYYYRELRDILRGKSNKTITDDHLQSINAQVKLRWGCNNANNNGSTEIPF